MAYQVRNINPLDLKPSTGIGVSIPFSSKSVFNTVYTTQDQIKFNLINYLLTGKRERVFAINFGAGLRNLLFENINNTNLENVKLNIKSGIELNFPNIIVSNIDVIPNVDYYTINVNVSYEIANTGITDEININFQNG